MSSLQHIVDHIVSNFHKAKAPLFVAIQGPQGSGKSYLSNLVKDQLSCSLNVKVALFSLDDLYLPNSDLVALANSNPYNTLLQGRGLPGTHDVQLGLQILSSFAQGVYPIELPRFDKSLFNGKGDRLPMDGSSAVISNPVDIVILEGWFTGFHPISPSQLEHTWNGPWRDEQYKLGIQDQLSPRKIDIIHVNHELKAYIPLWNFFTVLVQLMPVFDTHQPGTSRHSIVYHWRLQQEHDMKAQNGGKGMSDEGVRSFVDRYMPGYVFFQDTVDGGLPPWLGRSLRVLLSAERQAIKVEHF